MKMQEVKNYPDWGKMQFTVYPPKFWKEVIPGASEDAIDLVSKLVRYESKERMKASEVNFSLLYET